MDALVERGFSLGREQRQRIRAGAFTGPTSGLAPGNVQANLVILPQALANDFLRFAQANPRPCPVLAVSEPGDPTLPDTRRRISTSAPTCRAIASGATANWSRNRSTFVMSGATTWSASPSAARSRSRKRCSRTASRSATSPAAATCRCTAPPSSACRPACSTVRWWCRCGR